MYFANPWGLLGLLALPAILFIHLYQRRYPPLEVGGLHLWLSDETVKSAGQRRDRIPVTRTLLLELLAAMLLSLLLAQPAWNRLTTATHLVFVLDDSASMLATDGTGASFRDRAIATMRERAAASGRTSRVSLILTGTRPVLLAGPAVEWSEAELELKAWQPQGTRHSFQPAWDMATQLAESAGELLFVTDDVNVDGLPENTELVSVGQGVPNLAFETARWSVDPETRAGSLYLRIRNCSDSARDASLIGVAGAQEILRRPVSLAGRGSLPLSIELPGGLKQLELRIEAPDDRLGTDSHLTLLEPQPRDVRIGIDLPDDHSARDSLLRVFQTIASLQFVIDPAEADLLVQPLVADAPATQAGSQWRLAIGPVTSTSESNSPRNTAGPFLLDRGSPLLDGVTLQGILWSGVQPLSSPVSPLVSVETDVLMGLRGRGPRREVVLNIDLAGSNLGASPDWPILISNLVEACRDSRPGPRRWNYQVNELVWFELDPSEVDLAADEPLTLRRGNDERALVRGQAVEVPPLGETGVYEVLDGERTLTRFAVNFFDPLESDLSGLEGGTIPRPEATESVTATSDSPQWLWPLFIAAIGVVAVVNWRGLRLSKNDSF